MLRSRLCVAIAAAAVFVLTGISHASLIGVELIQNGGFEAGVDPGSFSRVEIGETDITGWNVTAGNIDYIGSIWTSAGGSRSIDMNGNTGGTIAQSFATDVGATYQLTFAMAGNPTMSEIMTLRAQAAGDSMEFTFDTAGFSLMDMGWETMTWTFTAASATTTLEFISLVSGVRGPALDNVSVVQLVPAPATALVMLFGGLLMNGRSRRRRA